LNYTKNKISITLRDWFLSINYRLQENKINHIIIGDIDSNELISYFYAFNQNSTKVLGIEDIKNFY